MGKDSNNEMAGGVDKIDNYGEWYFFTVSSVGIIEKWGNVTQS